MKPLNEQRTILDELRTINCPIVLFGASVAGRKIYCALKSKALTNELCFCDNYKQGIEPVTKGRIITPEELAAHYADAVICICIASSSYRGGVRHQLKEMGFRSEQILEYPQLAEAVLAEHGGELTWVDVESSYNWLQNHYRIAAMAEWLSEDDRSVIDFGAGDCYLKQCLRPDVKYIPTDYIARTSEHILFDFNADPFPDIRADVCFLGFTLVYAKDWKNFLRSVCTAANNKVIIGVGICMHGSNVPLLSGAEVSFYSDEGLIQVVKEQGFALKEKHLDLLGDGTDYNNLWLLFTRIK